MKQVRTIVYIAHPEIGSSSSQQFLLQTVQAYQPEIVCVDLTAEYERQGCRFDRNTELQRLATFQRVIFQFPLHWYQAPAILKQWIDSVFEGDEAAQTIGKEFGIVIVAGVKASAYQLGGREQITLSELLAPYAAFARYLGWQQLPILPIHQFAYLSEVDKMSLMLRYLTYLTTGTIDQFDTLQQVVSDQLALLDATKLALTPDQAALFQAFQQAFSERRAEIIELQALLQLGGREDA